MFPGKMGKMGKMLAKAQQAQAKMQEEIAALRLEGSAGGDVVRATVDGEKNLVGLEIEKDALEDADPQMLSDLVLAAVSDAQRKAEEATQQKMADLAGSLGLPPGLGL